ncbi:hypothetical protein BY458DRAFT_510632 [Sporodiniella umbellata]|nr:hypothetical protein BY458DRAFT_510632 [Sporodiniella umbellata]
MSYDNIGLTVSKMEAERLEVENAKRLLKDHKLSLILDLDQTIVHASCDTRISTWENPEIRSFVLPHTQTPYYIKLRPGLALFLKEIESLYDLHIYTMGTKEYAKAVAKEIDPEGLIFKEKILSRDESGCLTQKKLQRIFPCDTSMVVVLDDRSDVWSYSPNLVRIKPYEYFVGTGDIHNTDKKKEEDKESLDNFNFHEDQDKELFTILDILKQIHQTFYKKKEGGDVTKIVPEMKHKVLSQCIISLAPDLIPTNIRDPTLSWIWQMATSFGGSCSTDLTGKTTHLITIRHDTKVKTAKEHGHAHIVTPAWLLDSTARWALQPEELYSLPEEVDLESIEEAEKDEKSELDVDWDEVNKEVEDFMNESGIDDDGDTTDSDSTTHVNKVDSPTASLHKKWKRKRALAGYDDSTLPEDEENAIAKKRHPKRGKSQLSKVTLMHSHDIPEESTASESDTTTTNPYNNSVANSEDEDDLDSFVGVLEKELLQS